MLRRMAVQARAHADHAIGFVEKLHRGTRGIETAYACVILCLVREPGLRTQARADECTDALADLEHRIACT